MFGLSTNFIQSQVMLPLSSSVSHLSGLRGSSKTPWNYGTISKTSEQDISFSRNGSTHQYNKIHEIQQLLGIEKEFLSALKNYLRDPIHQSSKSINLLIPLNKKSHLSKLSPWYQSHSSFHTFTENKNGYPHNWQPILLQRVLRNQYFINSFVQGNIQTLKTRQSIERKSASPTSSSASFFTSWKKTQEKDHVDRSGKEKLNELFGKATSEEEKKSIKKAFIEGYLSADPKKETKMARFFKVLERGFSPFLILIVGYALYVAFGGQLFRNSLSDSEVTPEDISVSFDDIQGVEEAKEELQEIVEFLKNSDKFTALGAELPKGVLLVGPPGTGKTLLARAVAGEASVPFFHASGSQFDEVLVGQGAKRIRDLFHSAKLRAPCVVFIDEIDSVGGKRTSSGLHPYANQTINQLLSEMDGFHKNEGVIVLGATNRRDDLDTALLRPGRFDVEVQVQIPDLAGRKSIFDYYLSKIKSSSDVEVNTLARRTIGFTGADIKNIVNQAALRAASEQFEAVSMNHLEEARDKILMGPEKKSRIPDEEANTLTAYHEGGHAIVSHYTKHSDPIHKVTIVPRGHALGATAYIPLKEQYHETRTKMLAHMDTLMGGRAAEELIFGDEFVTSGATSDLQRATAVATTMVMKYGMSDRVGFRTFEEATFGSSSDPLSQTTREAIDGEIKRLLNDSYERAKHILKSHSREHKDLAEALLKYETLDADDVKTILDGKAVVKTL